MVSEIADIAQHIGLVGFSLGLATTSVGMCLPPMAYFYKPFFEKSYLGQILSRKELRKVKKKIGTELGVNWHQIKFGKTQPITTVTSTNAKEFSDGYITRIPILNDSEIIGAVWHKVKRPLLICFDYGFFYEVYDPFNKVDTATLVQQYLNENGLDFVPNPLTTKLVAGNLTLEKPGETLEELLKQGMSLDEKRAVFLDVASKMYIINDLTNKEFNDLTDRTFMFELLKRSELSFDGLERKYVPSSKGNKTTNKIATALKLKPHSVDNLLQYKSDLCHGDLNPSNMLVNDSKVVSLLDWSNTHIGSLYSELYLLQKGLGLENDRETNDYLDERLESKGYAKHPKAISRALAHLSFATQSQEYIEKTNNSLAKRALQHSKRYHLMAAINAVSSDSLSVEHQLISAYAKTEGVTYNDVEFNELEEAIGKDFKYNQILRKSYDQEFIQNESAIKDHIEIVSRFKGTQAAIISSPLRWYGSALMGLGTIPFMIADNFLTNADLNFYLASSVAILGGLAITIKNAYHNIKFN